MVANQNVVVAEIDNFIKRFDEGELVLAPETKTMSWITIIGKNIFGRPKKIVKNLPDSLGWYIASYKIDRESGSPILTRNSAYELLDLVERVRAWGVIRDIKQQTFAFQQTIDQLKEQIAGLKTLNEKLATENKRLHNLVSEETQKNKTHVGEVQSS